MSRRPLISVGVAGFEPTTSSTPCWRDTRLRYTPEIYSKIKALHQKCKAKIKSGWQDSNLRPPHPKCGAIPGYATPRTLEAKSLALSQGFYTSGAPERIRTPNPRSRNPIFYPVELRVQDVCKNRNSADKRKLPL